MTAQSGIPAGSTELSPEELRAEQLGILDAFASYAAEHELTWFLCAGTLLGAVRHEGFIPWDDDIDVMVPRADYDRLLAALDSRPIPGLSTCRIRRGSSYSLPFAKLQRDGTVIHHPDQGESAYGVNIDVFPLDSWPRSRAVGSLLATCLRGLSLAQLVKRVDPDPDRAVGKRALITVARVVLAPVSPPLLGRLAEWLVCRVGSTTGRWSGVMVWGYHERVSSQVFASATSVRFEGRELPAPAGLEDYLRALYGDYRALPPPEQRQPLHSFVAYRLTR